MHKIYIHLYKTDIFSVKPLDKFFMMSKMIGRKWQRGQQQDCVAFFHIYICSDDYTLEL